MLPMLVLIVDQDEARAEMYRRALARADGLAISASTADECASILSSFTPDAVVLDAELEEGPWVLATLAQRPGAGEVAVIVHSSPRVFSWPIALDAFPRCERLARAVAPEVLTEHIHSLLHSDRPACSTARSADPKLGDCGKTSGRAGRYAAQARPMIAGYAGSRQLL